MHRKENSTIIVDYQSLMLSESTKANNNKCYIKYPESIICININYNINLKKNATFSNNRLLVFWIIKLIFFSPKDTFSLLLKKVNEFAKLQVF